MALLLLTMQVGAASGGLTWSGVRDGFLTRGQSVLASVGTLLGLLVTGTPREVWASPSLALGCQE